MRKFLSLMTAILFAGSMMAADYVLTPLANVQSTDEVIIVGTQTVSGHEGTYAMSNDKGTSAAPAAVAVTVSNNKITTDATNILWNISVSDGSYTIRPNGDATNALYCTSTNNGVRVGTNANNAFVMDESGYFKNSATSRFVGLYQKQDWRCYTSLNANLANGGQSFAFYVKETEQGGQGGDDPEPTTYNLYLKSGSVNYAADNAVVAMWAWETNKEGAWYTFQPTETAGVYYVTLPLSVNNGKIMRWAEGTTPSWDVEGSAWNKTGDIAFPSTVPATTDMIELTAWNDATTGTWTKYVAPTYTDVYFVNKDNWTAVNVYGWDANGDNGWPGVAMTKTANKLFGLDVYKAQINDTFTKVIFNDGTNQTEDLDFVVAKPYFFDGIWYATLAEIPANCAVINAAANGTTITLKAGAVVVYAEGKYAYIKDDSGVAMIYASGSNHGLETGDTITANIAGSISVYKNLPEFVATTFPIEAKKAGEAPLIADATEEPKAENLNQVVVYKNVTFASSEYSSKAITGTWGDKEIKFYDQWNKTLVFDTEKIYNVTAASGVYNTNYQAYIIAAEPVCQDGPYALLVNGTTVIPAKMEAKEGYNEYAMYASLVKGDSVQVLNTSCGGLWIPTLEEAGAADHFAKGVAAATVDSTGCYDFYFKQIPNDQKMYIGFGICADDTIRYTVRGKGGILGEDFENAFDSKQDTLPLALAAGKYELKVVVGEDWKGFEQLTDTANGLTVGEMDNICFEIKEAGTVQVVYNDTVFKLIGNFYVPVPHYYLVGSMNNWKIGENEFIAGNEDSLSLEMTLFGDYNYQFKVVEVIDTDTTWYGLRLGEGQDWAPMVYGNCTGWWLDTKNGENDALNVKLLTTKAGKYTFIYEANENHEISVVIPEPAQAVPETKIAMLDGIFSIAKDAHAQFARGNLQYNYATQTWFTAEKQYDFLGEDPNLHFGDENYVGSIDLFGYSNEKSNYGLLVSNKDADFVGGGAFQDWGNLFEGGEYSSLSTKEWQYLLARKDEANNKLWTIIALTPTANSDDDIYGLVLFPDNWVKPEGLNFTYGFYNLDDDETLAGNTFTLEQWETFEEAGAVFLPMAGSRAGHIGCTNKGKEETTVVNPKVGWYCWVDNIGWYGYYWNSTMSATNDTVADYLIFPGWSEGPTLADEDDIWLAPQVWSREKRRGNSVRLVHKTYDPHYYLAGSMTNWKADSIALLPLDAERVDSLGAVLNLKADSLYELKVVRVQGDETTWFGLNETAAMTYGNSEGWWIYKSEDEVNQANVGLKTTKEAEYPVTLLVKDDHLVLSVAIPAPTPTAAVTGSMNNWEGQIPFELAEDEKTATLFVDNMKSGEYDFRMIIGGQERSNGWWFKRDVLGAAGITGNDENAMKLIADVDGDYTITWFFANDSIHFEFPAPAMFYVTGDSALVKDAAGLEKKDEWKAKAIKAEQDTLVLSLKADQEYKLKLIEDGNWEGGKVYGYDALTQEDKAGLSADNDNNIVFKLNEDGDVKVVYFWEEDTEIDEWKMTFKLIGDFYVEPEIPHTYTVVGPSLPNKWNETSTASDMTLVEGVYTYVLADVELKAGAHEYKIVEDHAWDVAFPQDGNASFSVEKDGIYDVTFTLDKETKAYTAVPELKQEIIIAPTAVLMGLAEVEPWTVGESMEVAEGFKTASITKHFVPSKAEGDTLKFKVVINDAWRSNAYLYHRGFVGAAGITMNIEGDDCNMKVVVDVEGDYTFTWTFENDSIGITFPEKPEPVMDDGYYIIGLNGWNVADLTADDMFWSTGIETGEFSLDVTLAAGNQFKVVRVVDDVIQEWYPAEGDNYVVDDHHYGATTVYFRPNYNGNEDWFAGCIYVLPTSTVDIDNLDTNAPAVKILRDGQILIIKGTKTFNIQGQLVR